MLNPYWIYIERLTGLNIINGYPWGLLPAGPCVPPQHQPYFLPYHDVTRGQATKIVANTFFPHCQTSAQP